MKNLFWTYGDFMGAAKTRYQLFLSASLSQRLEAAAKKHGVPKSALLEQALTVWLDRMGANALEDRFGRRIELLSAALARIERNDNVLLETLAVFIRYELSLYPPLADDDKVGRAAGRLRFEKFVSLVAKQLASGKRSIGGAAAEGTAS
jgi:hypothetical protein